MQAALLRVKLKYIDIELNAAAKSRLHIILDISNKAIELPIQDEF